MKIIHFSYIRYSNTTVDWQIIYTPFYLFYLRHTPKKMRRGLLHTSGMFLKTLVCLKLVSDVHLLFVLHLMRMLVHGKLLLKMVTKQQEMQETEGIYLAIAQAILVINKMLWWEFIWRFIIFVKIWMLFTLYRILDSFKNINFDVVICFLLRLTRMIGIWYWYLSSPVL